VLHIPFKAKFGTITGDIHLYTTKWKKRWV